MPTRHRQKPPPGFCFAQDSVDAEGNVVPGIATRLGISYHTYRKWRMAGKGPQTVRIGKCVATRIATVEDFLDHLAPAPIASSESRPTERRRRAA